MNPVFPIGILLGGRRCLVVGSTGEAALRAQRLLEAGATVRIVSPCPSDEVLALEHRAGVEFCRRPWSACDLDDCWLVVLADRDEALAQAMSAEAEKTRTFYCAVDQPTHNSFAHLALANSGAITVGISTNGRLPALARRLRDELQRVFDESSLAEFLELASEVRRRLAPELRREVLSSWMSRVRLTGTLNLPAPTSDRGAKT